MQVSGKRILQKLCSLKFPFFPTSEQIDKKCFIKMIKSSEKRQKSI